MTNKHLLNTTIKTPQGICGPASLLLGLLGDMSRNQHAWEEQMSSRSTEKETPERLNPASWHQAFDVLNSVPCPCPLLPSLPRLLSLNLWLLSLSPQIIRPGRKVFFKNSFILCTTILRFTHCHPYFTPVRVPQHLYFFKEKKSSY